ncbi:hypothetical protein PF008_g2596 [Phytophthora fragariae]|uniref:Crinkler effector protein N-terminal domain-containing protein n=1 Tax=Phytophthora fragariae TaxID=53985 RepID=A0A6G0SGV3_9STRA|nr:hypothetical protein PF008_g2596 [Phytophthora fragariae]
MKTLKGLVAEEGRFFTLDMENPKTVAHLKQAIKEKMSYQFPVDQMTLHLAKEDGEWLNLTDRDVKQLERGKIPDRIEDMMTEATEMHSALTIGDSAFDFPDAGEDGDEDVHVLVKIPDKTAASAAKKVKTWTAEELATVHPRVQMNVWKSVVRISISLSSKIVTTSTALVVDRTPTHLYLLTNLGLWADERVAGDVSSDFKKEIARFLRLHPLNVKGKKRDGHPQTSGAGKPQIVIEKLNPDDNEMEVIHEFDLGSDVCWKCSADLDFAVFKVPIPEDDRLVACKMASFHLVPTIKVHAYLFRTIPYQFGPPYAIVPAQITGIMGNDINLSAHGLPDGAVVCTDDGIAVGYLGGASIKKYPSCGFRLQRMVLNLPSASLK